MFTIINQQKKLFMSMMQAGFSNESAPRNADTNNSENSNSLALQIFKGQIAIHEANLKAIEGKSKSQLNPQELNNLEAAKKYAKLEKAYVSGKQSAYEESQLKRKQLNEILISVALIENKKAQEEVIIQESSKAQEEEFKKTLEENDSNLVIEAGTGETDFAKLRENVNYTSYEDMITKMSFDELKTFYQQISGISQNHNKIESGKLYYTPTNISELKKAFYAQGYKADGVFGGIEMGSLMTLVENVYKTQEKLNNSNDFKGKISVIFDYSQDGVLDNNVQFYTKEKQFFDAVKDETQFENLLKNLGYTNKEEFYAKFHDNYFAARQEFKMRLATVLDVAEVINPAEMLKNSNAVYEFNQYKYNKQLEQKNDLDMDQELWKEVHTIIQEHRITENLSSETQKGIELQAVSALVGSGYGVGASFDIKKATNAILDNLYVGNVQGTFGVGVSKKIIQNESGFAVDMGIVNFVPMISASGPINQAEYDEFKKLFPNEIDSKTQVSLGATVSTQGVGVVLDFANLDQETKTGIALAKERMSKDFDTLTKDIIEGKTFEESSLKNEPTSKVYYEALSGLYKSNKEDKHLFAFIKEGALNNYERDLYQSASEGVNYAGFSVGMLFLKGFLPIPLVMARGEAHDTTWNQVQTHSSTKVEETVVTTTEKKEFMETKFEKSNNNLASKIEKFESAFSFRTRYNEGAEEFINPENDLGTRWQGLIILSKRVSALKQVKLNQFLSTISSPEDKWTVISTFAQYVKKSNDYNNGNLTTWNTDTEKLIAKDRSRRSGFDGLFGFSLQNESQQYYAKLQEGKGNITKVTEAGLGFDATSSLNVGPKRKTIRGIDSLYTNLSMLAVNGEPIFIPITDQNKINAFITKINASKIDQETKNTLIEGINNKSIELNYYKDPEGFNDRILPRIKKVETTTTSTTVENNNTPVVDVFKPKFDTTTVGLAAIGEQRERMQTIETNGGYAYTTPDGQVNVVTDAQGNVISSSGSISVPKGSNIADLPPVDQFGNPITFIKDPITNVLKIAPGQNVDETILKTILPNSK